MSGDLPKGWVETSIEQFTDYVQRGKSPKYTIKSELPVINQKCVRWWGIDYDHVKYVSEDQWPSWSEERFVRDGDILWNSTGTGTIGRAALFQKTGYFKKIVCDSHVTIVRVSNLCSSHYLYWFIRSSRVQDAIMEMQAGSTNQVELARGEILATKVPLPPTAEQHRIVAKIDALFARSSRAREALAAIPALIDRYRQAVLAAAFRGDLTADWRKTNAAREQASTFVVDRQRTAIRVASSTGIGRDIKAALLITDEELTREINAQDTLFPLPDNWTWAAIGQVFGVYIGATPSRKQATYWNGLVPWVSSGEVAFTRISQTAEKITDEGLANTSTRLHPIGTVLLGMIGEGKTRGQAAILDIPACNNQNCAAIRVSEAGYPPEYLYWYFVASYEQTRTLGSGNGPQALNKDRVQRLLIPLPPPAEAMEITKRMGEMFAPLDPLLRETQGATHLLTRLDQSILDKAFSGRLVPQDPADEPAAQLLERIRAARAAAPNPKRGRRARG